jgi:hypothetical protein
VLCFNASYDLRPEPLRMWAAALAHFDSERAQRVSALAPDSEGETPAVFDPVNISFLSCHTALWRTISLCISRPDYSFRWLLSKLQWTSAAACRRGTPTSRLHVHLTPEPQGTKLTAVKLGACLYRTAVKRCRLQCLCITAQPNATLTILTNLTRSQACVP